MGSSNYQMLMSQYVPVDALKFSSILSLPALLTSGSGTAVQFDLVTKTLSESKSLLLQQCCEQLCVHIVQIKGKYWGKRITCFISRISLGNNFLQSDNNIQGKTCNRGDDAINLLLVVVHLAHLQYIHFALYKFSHLIDATKNVIPGN
jgi:hypothetical protein